VGGARGIEIFEGSFETMEDLPWRSFDLVISWDVLEHTPQWYAFAERLAPVIAPDGWLALTTLNRGSLAFRVFGSRWSIVVQDHFTYRNRRSLCSLFTSLGLTIVRETFGRGRDFVEWVARVSRSPDRRRGNEAQAEGPPQGDTDPGVVLLEYAINAGLPRLGVGVGVEMVLRPPGTE
jgi:hypothetical protein